MIKDKIDRLKKSKYYKTSKIFSVFTGIGIIQNILQIFLLWWLVDILKYDTLLVTSIVLFVLYILKYYIYVFIGLIRNKFIKYNMVNLVVMILGIFGIWLLVDYLGIYAYISSIIVALFSVVLRFAILNMAGIIKND